MRGLSQATVYHLFGRVSAMPNYVVTEEDMLEFVHFAIDAGRKRPELLFDELKNNHLLLIGTRFPDWLTRFFLRAGQGDAAVRWIWDCTETLIDSAGEQQSLVVFLNSYSRPTRVFTGGPTDFVAELLKRYQERHGKTAGANDDGGKGEKESETDEMPAGAVFISYASEDLARDVAKAI